MNLYPLDIHLFEVSLTVEFTKLRTDDLVDEQSGSRSIEELPSEFRFRFEEFWSAFRVLLANSKNQIKDLLCRRLAELDIDNYAGGRPS